MRTRISAAGGPAPCPVAAKVWACAPQTWRSIVVARCVSVPSVSVSTSGACPGASSRPKPGGITRPGDTALLRLRAASAAPSAGRARASNTSALAQPRAQAREAGVPSWSTTAQGSAVTSGLTPKETMTSSTAVPGKARARRMRSRCPSLISRRKWARGRRWRCGERRRPSGWRRGCLPRSPPGCRRPARGRHASACGLSARHRP